MDKLNLVVFTQYPNAYGPTRLHLEAEKLKLNSRVISFKNVDLKNLPQANTVILREPNARDFIYDERDKILNFYINQKTKVLNCSSYKNWSILDKLLQHKIFEKENIPHIKLLKLEDAKYPFIVKDKLGSHGSHVFKITNKSELDEVFAKGYKKQDLLIQEFQKSGFDLRAIVLNDKVLGIMKRTPKKGEFLSNFSQGGKIENAKNINAKNINKIATRTANAFKLDFVGVDLMLGNDGNWKVLEVNRACQFKGFEKAIKINVASEIIKFLISTSHKSLF